MRIQTTTCGHLPRYARGLCRTCYKAAYRAANREDLQAKNAAYYAAHRDELCAANAAYWRAHPEQGRAAKTAYNAAHPEKRKTAGARYRAAHPEKRREQNHRRRARVRSQFVAPVDAAAIYARDGSRCHICGRKVRQKDASMDHLVPISLGGTHEPANVRLAHRRCNHQRNIRGPAQLIML